MDLLSIYSRANRKPFLIAGSLLILAIAFEDFRLPQLPLGYLYIIPILLMTGYLPRRWTVALVLLCSALTALLSHNALKPATTLFGMTSLVFSITGLFVCETVHSRQKELAHIEERETQIRLRQETEEQLIGLMDTSPLAIITLDASGAILLANDAAQSLFAPGGLSIKGQPIAQFLPTLHAVTQQPPAKMFRTQIRCRGRRENGKIFLAAVWFSTSATAVGNIVSAIIVDFSEDLRDREDLSLEHLLRNAKILVGALAHEVRNLCGAASVVYKNLSRLEGMEANEDFRALGALIAGLENLSMMELRSPEEQGLAAVELSSVLDELRIVIGPTFEESGMEILWRVQENLPLAVGDRYGLLQVFLNLARNSQRAMESTAQKRLTISSELADGAVVIRFEDTGIGLPDPSGLFRPFYQSATAAGLGLYVSRAILRSFRGDVQYEARNEGACFAVRLARYVEIGDITQ